MSDAVIIISLVAQSAIVYLLVTLNHRLASAAVLVDEVKETLKAATAVDTVKLDGLAKVAKSTHQLVNSNFAVQLQLNKAVTRRLADITRDPADIEAAALADRTYAEHMEKQALVDEQPGTDAEKSGEA